MPLDRYPSGGGEPAHIGGEFSRSLDLGDGTSAFLKLTYVSYGKQYLKSFSLNTGLHNSAAEAICAASTSHAPRGTPTGFPTQNVTALCKIEGGFLIVNAKVTRE